MTGLSSKRSLKSLGSFSANAKIQPYFVPISALVGDNVVSPSSNMPWFDGPNLLEYLERVPVGSRTRRAPFRFPRSAGGQARPAFSRLRGNRRLR